MTGGEVRSTSVYFFLRKLTDSKVPTAGNAERWYTRYIEGLNEFYLAVVDSKISQQLEAHPSTPRFCM